MSHTGAYNDVFILVLVSMLFIPFILVNFGRLFSRMFGNKRQYVHVEQEQPATLDDFFIVHHSELSQPVEPQPVLTREQQWNLMVQSAMEQAMNGDKTARDWVTKNVFSQADQASSSSSSTDRQIIRDAYDGLKSLGYKPKELRDKLKELCASKTYTNVDDLIQDFIRGA